MSDLAGHHAVMATAAWTRYLWLLWILWLAFLVYPLNALFLAGPSPGRIVLVLAAAALFAGIYAWNVQRQLHRIREGHRAGTPWLTISVLVTIAISLTLGDRRDWIELFIFVGVSMGPSLPAGQAVRAVGGVVVLMLALGLAIGVGLGPAAQIALQGAVSGFAVIFVVRTIVMDRELRLAREEIVRLAISEERLRFARDLHDLLGHSLSLIALKSELVGRLIPIAPERARVENQDVETVARQALHEVREAVAGYRQPTLASELENARELLEAAGIRLKCDAGSRLLEPAQEAVLAWAVREGVTNVIKHSRARHCTIRLTDDGNRVGLEVEDDGIFETPDQTRSTLTERTGSGLRGLAERAAALGGRCESRSRAGGGFRLIVTLPAASSKHHSPGMVSPA